MTAVSTIPADANTVTSLLADSVSGNTRTLTISQLRQVKTILTVSDEDKQLVNEGE